MTDNPSQEQMLQRFRAWAAPQENIRALLMTSTRATPHGPVDALSDYDLILVARDVHPFFNSRDWLSAFGRVLALYRDPLTPDGDFETVGYIVQFEDGLKMDFWAWPVGLLRRIVNEPQLPAELDAGYQVLLDKDSLTADLKPATYKGYMPTPPTEAGYQEVIECFFLDTGYVAKYLWRDDVIAAKHIMDAMLKQEHMLPMLEWRAALDHDWSIRPGPHGRRLRQWLPADLWAELENTYTGAAAGDNWDALFRTITLMRRVAVEVGARLGYAYPHEMDARAVAYVQKIRHLDNP